MSMALNKMKVGMYAAILIVDGGYIIMYVFDLLERLQNGEKILCTTCKKGYYTTCVQDVSLSREFMCDKCNSVIRVTPNIIVE